MFAGVARDGSERRGGGRGASDDRSNHAGEGAGRGGDCCKNGLIDDKTKLLHHIFFVTIIFLLYLPQCIFMYCLLFSLPAREGSSRTKQKRTCSAIFTPPALGPRGSRQCLASVFPLINVLDLSHNPDRVAKNGHATGARSELFGQLPM